jgi:hypothetical protein
VPEIKVYENKKISVLQKEFNEKFPFLNIKFFTPEEWDKSHSGGVVEAVSNDQTISEVRGVFPKDKSTISIHGRTKIGNLEKVFLKEFGLYVQVCVQSYKGSYYTGLKSDEKSLTQLNEYLSKNGYLKGLKS